jgi:hypothetical protein
LGFVIYIVLFVAFWILKGSIFLIVSLLFSGYEEKLEGLGIL